MNMIPIRSIIALTVPTLAMATTSPSLAALPQGAKAPDFSAQGALGGKPFAFNLRQALRRGPVVLYFFPKAFTPGCTMEAHAFAESAEDFQKAGATVIGMSTDDQAALEKFSSLECRNKFPVASASPAVVSAYDVAFKKDGKALGLTDRTSYVIGTDGKIVMVHSDLDWRGHVIRSLAAVRKLHR
jgi:peroxiredoxin